MVEKIFDLLQKKIKIDVRYTFHSGFWLISAHLIGIVAILLTSYAFANLLSPETYGQYKYIISIGALLTALSLSSASTAISQAAARNVTGFFALIKRKSFYYGLSIFVLSMVGALYYYLNGNTSLALGLLIIGILQPFFNNSSLIFSYLLGKQQFKRNAFVQILNTIFVTSAIIISILFTKNVAVLLVVYF